MLPKINSGNLNIRIEFSSDMIYDYCIADLYKGEEFLYRTSNTRLYDHAREPASMQQQTYHALKDIFYVLEHN